MKKLFLTLTLVIFVIPFGMSQDLPAYVPTDGLIAYYPFNGNANDASGNGNHGTVNGATLTSDRDGNENSSYSFDGVNDYIDFGKSLLTNSNSNYTFSCWIKNPDSGGSSHGMIFSNQDIAETSLRIMSDGQLSIQAWLNSNTGKVDYNYSVNIIENEWNKLTYSFNLNSEYLVVMVNSQIFQIAIPLDNISFFDFSGNTAIGRNNNAQRDYSSFLIDEVSIWNRALSEQEIQNLYNSSTGDIILNGVVSAESNQIKNVADPTDAQDAVTKNYTYSKTEVDALIANLQQQINEMNQTITSSELEGNWNVKELYYLNPDTNEITSTFPTPECSKPYQYYEFLASKEIFWTGIGTNWVTQSCTSNEFGVKQDPYTITTENISGDDPITYINFPGGSGTRNWEVISRPSENTIIIRAWQNNEITLYNNQVYGLKLVKEARIE